MHALEIWHFIDRHLQLGYSVVLLVVAESSGSSPGRAGYKMAVTKTDLCGSIGGGVMEVNLVEHARSLLSKLRVGTKGFLVSQIIEQVHQKNSPHSSGMICSGRQTVLLSRLTDSDAGTISKIGEALANKQRHLLNISPSGVEVQKSSGESTREAVAFQKTSESEFMYIERLGHRYQLYIIGGGHCSLALSELMSKLDFSITIFDDRRDLNTIEKNRFADDVRIIDSYENIGDHIASGPDTFVVVMTLGYKFDEIVIRNLIDKKFRYLGVLGSKAKMAVLLRSLENEGVDPEKLSRIHTPIGLPINSHTPEEIAVSIAAEIISVKNST